MLQPTIFVSIFNKVNKLFFDYAYQTNILYQITVNVLFFCPRVPNSWMSVRTVRWRPPALSGFFSMT